MARDLAPLHFAVLTAADIEMLEWITSIPESAFVTDYSPYDAEDGEP